MLLLNFFQRKNCFNKGTRFEKYFQGGCQLVVSIIMRLKCVQKSIFEKIYLNFLLTSSTFIVSELQFD